MTTLLNRLVTSLLVLVVLLSASAVFAADSAAPIRVGIIGLDTSHVIAFTKIMNSEKAEGDLADMRIVAAFPGGSPDIPSSWDRVGKFTEQLREQGVEICDSIPAMLEKVDAVLLESLDGRPHLEQAKPVIAAGKPLFIDKPLAGTLADCIEIFRLAKEKGVPCFSSSSLRFSEAFQQARAGEFGKIQACTAWSPMSIEPHHPDLFWYGIHGVEILFTVMGPGCKEVVRESENKVVGTWADGRKGVFVGGEKLHGQSYGADVEAEKKTGYIGTYDGYGGLVREIAAFLKTGKPPVAMEETLEIYAFMEAADESKRQGGKPVAIEAVMKAARAAAAEK